MELTLSICSDFAHLMKGTGKQEDKKPQQRKREEDPAAPQSCEWGCAGIQTDNVCRGLSWHRHWSCQFHKGYQQPSIWGPFDLHRVGTGSYHHVFSKSYLQTAVILKEKGSPSWFLKILVYSYWRNFRRRRIEKQRNCIKKGGRKRNLFKKNCDFFSPKRPFWKGLYVAFLLEFSEKAKLLQGFVKSEGL